MALQTNPLRRPTTSDVAREAGVSRGVVSYVLNGDPQNRVSAQLTERVWAAVEVLGYSPSASARLLRGGKSNTVLVLSSPIEAYSTTMGKAMQALAEALARHHMSMAWQLLLPGITRPVGEISPGLVLTGPTAEDEDFGVYAKGFTVPVVTAFPGRDEFFAGAATSQLTYLHERGHRRVAFVRSHAWRDQPSMRLRERAAREYAYAHEIEFVVLDGPEAVPPFLVSQRADDSPLALAAHDDGVALETLMHMRQAGLSSPRHASIIGVNDVPTTEFADPPLTTVTPRLEQYANEFAPDLQALHADHDHVITARMPTVWDVVERQSVDTF